MTQLPMMYFCHIDIQPGNIHLQYKGILCTIKFIVDVHDTICLTGLAIQYIIIVCYATLSISMASPQISNGNKIISSSDLLLIAMCYIS